MKRASMLVALVLVTACHRGANVEGDVADSATGQSGQMPVARDTLRGVVSLVGSEPLTTFVLTRTDRSRVALDASGNAGAAAVRNVVGLDIMVRGARTDARAVGGSPQPLPAFRVDEFIVRAADGARAYDGVVMRESGTFFLRLADGSRIGAPKLPVTLQRQIGARVFVAGPLDAPPIAYGIIAANQPPI